MSNEHAILRRLAELSGRPFTTAEAARLVGVASPKALRRLEARGVVDAPPTRSAAKGYRVYSQEDVSQLKARLLAGRDARG